MGYTLSSAHMVCANGDTTQNSGRKCNIHGFCTHTCSIIVIQKMSNAYCHSCKDFIVDNPLKLKQEEK